MKRFDYLAPTSLSEAVELFKENPGITPLAGGTDLLVQIKERHRPVLAVISLRRIREVHESTNNGLLTIGSAVTVGQIARDHEIQRKFTALAIGASLIGSVQLQNMATVGGTFAMPHHQPIPPRHQPLAGR